MKNIMIVLLLWSWAMVSFAEDAATQLQQNLSNLHSLRASFSQTVARQGRVSQHTTGTLVVKRPGGFRWEAQTPIHQLIVSNSQQLWIYDKDLKQVTLQRASRHLGATPALFLSGNIDQISQYYHVTAAPLGRGMVYTLTPIHRNEGFRYLQLRFEKNSLVAMRFQDQLGQTTDLRLRNIQLNPSVSNQQFAFAPPAGVDVIRE